MPMLFAEGKHSKPVSILILGQGITSVECQQLVAGSEAVVPVPLMGVGRQRMQEVF